MPNVGFKKGYECEDCGRQLTYRDFYLYVWEGGAPVGEIPRCCESCAESESGDQPGRSEMSVELDDGFKPNLEL